MALGRTRGTLVIAALFVSTSQILIFNYYDSTTPVNTPTKLVRGKTINDAESRVVQCEDSNSCQGFFQFSGPNHSPESVQLYQTELDTYMYADENNTDGHMIFIPSETKSGGCVQEWKQATSSWADRGMSGYREDITIYDTFFRDESFQTNGVDHFYMEIGANDGVRESNTRFFDLCLGWKGLLVEPNPKNFKRMERLRPSALHLGVAPSCNSPSVVMFPAHSYTNAVADEDGATIAVHCGSLDYYLERIGINHIDFWSLDVEGSELSILETVDFSKVHIDIIMSESSNRLEGAAERMESVRNFLRQHGYLLLNSVYVFRSDVFLHKSLCHRYNFPECKHTTQEMLSEERSSMTPSVHVSYVAPSKTTANVLFGLYGAKSGVLAEFEVALKSLLLNAPLQSDLTIHIMADSDACRALGLLFYQIGLNGTTWRNLIRIQIYNVESYLGSWMNDLSSMDFNFKKHTIGAYFRLYAHHVLPNNIQHLLYMDTDVVIMANLENLWNIIDEDAAFQWGEDQCDGFIILNLQKLDSVWDMARRCDLVNISKSTGQDLTDQLVFMAVNRTFPNVVAVLPDEWAISVAAGVWMHAKDIVDYRPRVGMLHFAGGGSSTDEYWKGDFVKDNEDTWGVGPNYYVKLPWNWAKFIGQSMTVDGKGNPLIVQSTN